MSINPEHLFEFLTSPLFFALAMLILVYFGLIHPYRKKIKERENFLKGLKIGQLVVTSGGVVGEIARIEEDFVWLQIAPNVEVLVVIDHVIGFCKPN